jgi:hypothetical protein
MTVRTVDPWCGRIVELAARLLPAEQRQRYALEFIAELYGMPRSQQARHSTQVLAHAWALRTALNAASRTTTQERTMTPTTRRSLPCLLGIHHWHWANTEDGERYRCCLRCGLDKTESAAGTFRVGKTRRT